MKKTLLSLAAAAALAAPMAAPLAAQQDLRTTIAVMPFANGGMLAEYAPLGVGLAALMLNDLATNGKIRVVERDAIEKILQEQKISASGAVDPATIVRVGKLLGAKYTITGTIITTQTKEMQLAIKAYNMETSEIIYTEKTSFVKANKFAELIETATKNANARLNLPQLTPNSAPAREAAAKQEQAKKMPIETALLYSRALEAKDNGKTAEAKTLFSKVLTDFPNYEPAQKELDKLPK
ncbi:MAG TPA: CsgG/HfaB family protein [Gemmatimonadaceae bacterium]|nr:CsgG/HfaB family protein [Gemmatimonadaceae bacterium]